MLQAVHGRGGVVYGRTEWPDMTIYISGKRTKVIQLQYGGWTVGEGKALTYRTALQRAEYQFKRFREAAGKGFSTKQQDGTRRWKHHAHDRRPCCES